MAPTRLQHDHDLNTFPSSLHRRRILVCVESFGPINGVSRTNLKLVDHLRSHGVSVSVVAPYNHTKVDTFAAGDVGPDQSILGPEIRLSGYPVPFNPELSIVYPVRLGKLYERTFGTAPDLIYLGSPASIGFQVMLQLRQQPDEAQVPVICNFQTDLAGYCAVLFPPPLGAFGSWLFAKVEGYLFRHESVKTVFYPSIFVRNYLEHRCGVGRQRMRVLRRGVDTDAFNPSHRSEELREHWAPNGEILLLTCTRLAGEKGFEFLSQVATELEGRGLHFKLVVVGGNRNKVVEQEVKDYFQSMVERGKVVFTGFRVGDDLTTAYASADVFLHCSITETFGLVVLEAMASGVPVVARDEGGPSDIIAHGTSGYLVPAHDLDGFVDMVVKLSHDRSLRQQFAQASRAQACDATWEKINNTVAWTMMDAIEHRANHQAQVPPTTAQSTNKARAPMFTWFLLCCGLRGHVASSLAHVKTVWALFIILAFWAVVAVYLVFTSASHLLKTASARPKIRRPSSQG